MKSKFVSVVAAVAALVGVSSAATAQEGRRFNWSGVYFGAGAGSLSSKADWEAIGFTASVPGSSATDAILALHAGYQHQFMGGLVIGGEMGYGRALGASFGGPVCANGVYACVSRVDDVFTIGGRLGFALDNLLLYGTAGYAQANVTTQGNVVGGGVPNDPLTRKHGGTYFGGGFEVALTKTWSIGVDYKHIDLAAENHCTTSACVPGNARSVDPQADIVTARFSYKFSDERHYRPLK